MRKKETMDREGAEERGDGPYRAALTLQDGNEERESEEGCKWAAEAATQHSSDSPGSVTASPTF